MGMFNKFERYKYTLDGIITNVTNIGMSILIDTVRNVDNRFAFQKYVMSENEIPESISEKMYGDAKYYWTILVVNDIINPFHDLPLDSETLIDYIKDKYVDIYEIHHYINMSDNSLVDDYNTDIIRNSNDPIPDTIRAITNYEYEYELNESKRNIKIVNPVFIKDFTYSYMKALDTKIESTIQEEDIL